MRFLVKSKSFRKTPVLLKRQLGLDKLVSFPGRYQPALDYQRDCFLAFPPVHLYPNQIANVPDTYDFLSSFYTASKARQRSLINQSGIKTPESYASSHFVVRPLRHYGGADYRITEDPNDFNPASEYIAPAFPKWREYRAVFVKGNPLVLLRKKPGPNAGPYEAWNHTNGSFFQTVHCREESPLAGSSFFSDAASFCVSRDTHIVAVDVLLNRSGEYAVTEYNFSPAISIAANLEVISHDFARS